jgi:ribonucleotide monophosphatase NagD (HAD superfamily)
LHQDEIFSSASVAVYYIKHVAKLKGKVYVMGCPGLIEELDKEHIPHIGFGVCVSIKNVIPKFALGIAIASFNFWPGERGSE